MSEIIREKVNQAVNILDELGVDAWLTFARETSAGGDPALALIYGSELTWQSALIITRQGKKIAILGRYDADTAERLNAYDTIVPYDKGIKPHLLKVLGELNPSQIAINYSTNDVLADGLTYGLYQVLTKYLLGTDFGDRLISAEPILSKLRARKTPSEIERIRAAIRTTEKIFEETFNFVQPGLSEIQISDYMHRRAGEMGVKTAWEYNHCPIVDAGAQSPVGHTGPTDTTIEKGQILHIDFGVMQDGYCADIQRLAYLPKNGETKPSEDIQAAFQTVLKALQNSVIQMKPGIPGLEIDQIAREVITSAGYPEFMHATGHHLGQLAHDGGGLLGPKWEKYGEQPDRLLESGHVYTVEPSIFLPGFGMIALEEDVLVTDTGAEYLSNPQTEIELL
jgi:Xaa-Pro aminopeptidase